MRQSEKSVSAKYDLFCSVYSLFWLKILWEGYLLNRVRVPSHDLGWVAFSSCWAGSVVMLSQSWFLLCLRRQDLGKVAKSGSPAHVIRCLDLNLAFLIF